MSVHYRDREMESKSKRKKFTRENRDHILYLKNMILSKFKPNYQTKLNILLTSKSFQKFYILFWSLIKRNREVKEIDSSSTHFCCLNKLHTRSCLVISSLENIEESWITISKSNRQFLEFCIFEVILGSLDMIIFAIFLGSNWNIC